MKITKERAIEIAERITVNWRIPFSRSDIRYREAEIELWTSYYNIESSTKFENPVWAITQTWERQSDGLNDSYTVFVDSETGAFYKQKQFNDYLRVLQRGQEEKERKEARVKMIEKFLAEVKEFGTKHPEMVDSIAHIMELFRFCQQKEPLSFQEASEHFLACLKCQTNLQNTTLLAKLRLETLKSLDRVGAEDLDKETEGKIITHFANRFKDKPKDYNDWRRP